MGKDKSSKVQVKNSYYTFSEEYPVHTIEKPQKNSKNSFSFFKAFLAGVCFLVFILLGYFITQTAFEVSKKSYSDSDFAIAADDKLDLFNSSFSAFKLARNDVSNEKAINKLIRTIKRNDGTSVIVDFKDDFGNLLYSSNSLLASKEQSFDNNTIRRMIQLFHNKGIFVVAEFSCFKDTYAANLEPDMAVKFEDTDVNWADSSDFAWLNPYSKDALQYLRSLLLEVADFEVDGILLKNFSFPYSGDVNSAFFKGERKRSSRSTTLLNFKEEIDKLFPSSSIVLEAEQGISDYDAFEGSLTQLTAHVVYNLVPVPEGYEIDENSQFASLISLMSRLESSAGIDSSFILPNALHSHKSIKFFKKTGFESIIIEDGSEIK